MVGCELLERAAELVRVPLHVADEVLPLEDLEVRERDRTGEGGRRT